MSTTDAVVGNKTRMVNRGLNREGLESSVTQSGCRSDYGE